ncbi:hypothetical protein GURASL_06820 [Geotalea uraniireducens]|uniref:Methyltransferase type 11 domain-containing protein n=1 Tax=Geotalea uraniireducens TaxID=351604 RepID=A0ABM8EH53_9BACT|nr:hypothetical protein GURASL_06820 [Geotalea uraniireducens]
MLSLLRKTYFRLLQGIFFQGRQGLENADAALRYFPISDTILEMGGEASILEVGSGCTGITPYIPHKVTGVDVSFEQPVSPNLTPVLLSGENLPFNDSSFDIVVSVDMLEHVPAPNRPTVISELLRVARKRVYLAVPCGNESEEHDRLLNDLYTARHGEAYPFLVEHVENGLPTAQEISTLLELAAADVVKKIRVRSAPNVNLKIREWFSRIWIRSPKAYGLLSPLICIFRRFYNFGNCYRRIFMVEIDAGE